MVTSEDRDVWREFWWQNRSGGWRVDDLVRWLGVLQDPPCIICRYYLHLSAVVCSCRPSKAVCLQVGMSVVCGGWACGGDGWEA